MSLSEQEQQRLEKRIEVLLRGEDDNLSRDQKIEALQKRGKKMWTYLLINFAAVLFFGYSFYFDITQLSDTVLKILGVVFVINTLLIFYQKSQISKAIAYLQKEEAKED